MESEQIQAKHTINNFFSKQREGGGVTICKTLVVVIVFQFFCVSSLIMIIAVKRSITRLVGTKEISGSLLNGQYQATDECLRRQKPS